MVAGFYEAVLAWLIRRGVAAVQVTYVDTNVATGGGCETCEWTYAEIEIDYNGTDGRSHTETYDGGLACFLNEITPDGG